MNPNPLISCRDCGYPAGTHHKECPGQPFPSEAIEDQINQTVKMNRALQKPAQVTNPESEPPSLPVF